jgi:hypothetical protein
MFYLLNKIYGDVSDVNVEAVTNIHFHYRLSFVYVVDVVSARYKP